MVSCCPQCGVYRLHLTLQMVGRVAGDNSGTVSINEYLKAIRVSVLLIVYRDSDSFHHVSAILAETHDYGTPQGKISKTRRALVNRFEAIAPIGIEPKCHLTG